MNENHLHRFVVKLNSGSGCLFQPTDENYTYVLTARHVVAEKEVTSVVRQILKDPGGELVEETYNLIGSPFYHPNEKIDAAILKIKKVEGIDLLLREHSLTNKVYQLCGHPKSRAKSEFSFRNDSLTYKTIKQFNYVEGELSKNAVYKEIVGQSGGGVIRIDDGIFLLAGIQKKMAADDNDEMLSRIEFMPISLFDEIVTAFPEELSPIFPPYIKSFLHILAEIFPLNNMPLKKDLIKEALNTIAKPLCSSFSPEKILKLYSESLLVNGTDKSMMHRKELWISLLELLAISQLHSTEELSFEQIKNIHKKRRLLFADTDEWFKTLNDIYRSDLSEIEKGGYVVIATSNDRTPTLVEAPKVTVPNIAAVPTNMNISSTVKNPFIDLQVVHIYKFQSELIRNAVKYTEVTAANITEQLRQNTNGVI